MLSFLHGVHSWARWWPRGKILFPYTVYWLAFAQKRENFLISDPRLQSSERINACCPKAPSCLVLCYSSLQKLIHHIQVKRKKKNWGRVMVCKLPRFAQVGRGILATWTPVLFLFHSPVQMCCESREDVSQSCLLRPRKMHLIISAMILQPSINRPSSEAGACTKLIPSGWAIASCSYIRRLFRRTLDPTSFVNEVQNRGIYYDSHSQEIFS